MTQCGYTKGFAAGVICNAGTLMILVVFLIMVTYIPIISTLLPHYFMGPEVIIK